MSNQNFQKVLLIKETISAAPNMTVGEIKKYADAVSIRRASMIKGSDSFTTSFTTVVDDMHAANITVYAFPFRNEFVSLAFDFFSDPMMEIATYLAHDGLGVDGVMTEFPATANAYLSKFTNLVLLCFCEIFKCLNAKKLCGVCTVNLSKRYAFNLGIFL